MLGFQGPAQPSPTLGDAINAGHRYLEVRCLGCNTHQTVALDIVRRPKATPVHELPTVAATLRRADRSTPPKARKRTRDALPDRIGKTLADGAALLRAKGRVKTRGHGQTREFGFLLKLRF
jgi:hypothetical protein